MATNSTQFSLPSAHAARSLKQIQHLLAQITERLERLPNLSDISDSKPIPLQALPHPQLRLLHPPLLVTVLSSPAGDKWLAMLPELQLQSRATRCAAAVTSLSRSLVDLYLRLESRAATSDSRWVLISQLVGRLTAADLPSTDDPPLPPTFTTEHQTFPQWVKRYSPNPSSKAWTEGAYARLQVAKGQPEPASRFRNEPFVSEWRSGYQALASYLSAGGLVICAECHQSLSPSSGATHPC